MSEHNLFEEVGGETETTGGNPGKKPKLGTGARFAALEKKLAVRGDIKNSAAVAAYIGRKKFGKKRFQKLAVKGRKE